MNYSLTINILLSFLEIVDCFYFFSAWTRKSGVDIRTKNWAYIIFISYLTIQTTIILCLHYCNFLLIFLLCPIIEAHSPSPFDVRIDHHKVETIRDLIINTNHQELNVEKDPITGLIIVHIGSGKYEFQLLWQ